ncbi:MAG: ATP-binding protein [Bacteroidales bacterium]|nr:ATP-binding protein [Bacteroidales bacterium]
MKIERNYYLNKLIDHRENGRIKVITGIRRCGKSVLLFDIFGDYLLKSGINENQIITMRLDEITNLRYRNPMELDQYVREMIIDKHQQYYIFIDEIQEVKPIQNPWFKDKDEKIGFVEVLLGFLSLKNVDVYVTGSNSKMLSSDIMTEFRDRGDEIHVNPLTFKEYYDAYEDDKRNAWRDFITYGGLPKIMSEKKPEDKSNYLQYLIKKTYLADVIERNKIKNNKDVLDDLLNIIASNIGSLTNPTKLENTFQSVKRKKVNDTTISTYLDYFSDAFLIRKAYQFDVKGKKYINTPMKYYFSDIGLRNAQLNFRQQEETHIMENVIYNELSARGFNVDVGIVTIFNKDQEGKTKRSKLEIDFVVNKIDKRCYIQSAFALPNEDKRLQETNSLLRINDSYKKIVVVRENIIPWYDEDGIYYIGVEDFALKFIDELTENI